MPSLDLVMAYEIASNDLKMRAALADHDVEVARLTAELRGSHRG